MTRHPSSYGAVSGRPACGPRILAVCALAVVLAGCTTSQTSSPFDGPELETRLSEAEVKSEIDGNIVAKAAYWGGLYEQNPSDAEAAAEYASALRAVGSIPAAVEVLRRADALNPDDPRILAEYGKTLTAAGGAGEALVVFDRALAIDPDNWRTLTAQGVAFDQLGQHEAARASYRAAIAAAPGEPSPWNNLGLSYALTNDLEDAELAMRQALSTPKATAQMRQNLALILGLRGDYSEADRLARAGTPAAAIDGSAEDLRAIVTQPALWTGDANADNNPLIIE